MEKRRRRQVFLGIQWDLGSWESLPSLFDQLIDTITDRPLLWSFPAPAPETSRRTLGWLEKTLGQRAGRDLVAALGFAGACHPLLTLDELRKEVSWALANPWGTGLFQMFHLRPRLLLPRVPDLNRPEAMKIYASRGFTSLGVPCGRDLAWFSGVDGLDCFTCDRLALEGFREPSPRWRPIRGGNRVLVLDLSGKVTPEDLQQALERLVLPLLAGPEEPFPLLSAHEPAVDMAGLAPHEVDWSPFPAPLLREAARSNSESFRRKRRKSVEYRTLLTRYSLAAATDSAQPAPAAGAADGTRLVAQMLGEVALSGSHFDVRLAGGRFTGISRAGRDFLPVRPARSYLRVQGRILPFRTRNSFSFEGEGGTGLREVLSLDSPEPAELTIEYSFCDDCPMLEIIAEVQWPRLAPRHTVQEHAPLVIALKELARGEEAVIESTAPDGSLLTLRPAAEAWTLIPGEVHRIALGPGGSRLVLRPGPLGAQGWSLASFRVSREGRRRFLEISPFGGWYPLRAAILSGRKEKFSLLVGLEDEEAGGKARG